MKNLETQIEQLAKDCQAKAAYEVPNSSIGQCKIPEKMDEGPSVVLPCQLPPKELSPGSFTLPYTIGSLNLYAMADLGASVNIMPRSMFNHLKLTNLKKTYMLVEMADMTKSAPVGIVKNVLVKKCPYVNKAVKKVVLNEWILDCFEEESGTDKDLYSRKLKDYHLVFDIEIEQLEEKYKLGIGKKGYIL
ncbi:reverse transcriptase domain-containing protein [Tanacetum coccineum]